MLVSLQNICKALNIQHCSERKIMQYIFFHNSPLHCTLAIYNLQKHFSFSLEVALVYSVLSAVAKCKLVQASNFSEEKAGRGAQSPD